jgi:predicted O-linked N-acetylglucosamine transferase (SPINDLY family)/glycosyltransferase involved in cell wall biosynthesis
MNKSNKTVFFDAIIFYFWLPEEELKSIFDGMHKWWFAHGLGYDRCVFYGPKIKAFKHFKNGKMDMYAIPSDRFTLEKLKEFLAKQNISHNPIVSIVVEGDRLPSAEELVSASLPIQCFVADTHHMSNPLTAAISYLKKVGASMVFASHSPHRRIFSDCIGINAYPIVYTPNDTFGATLKITDKTDLQTCYYGTVADLFHPERSYYLKKIMESGETSANIKFKPRMQPRAWLESLSKDLASFTCSLNGFPSVQSYAPLLTGTCLITDCLSEKSDLAPHLKHEVNCLIYNNESEAIRILNWIKSNPEDATKIAKEGNKLLHQITPTFDKALAYYCQNTNDLHGSISVFPDSRSKIHLDLNAVTACYAYETIQEIHRLCKKLAIVIQGETETSKYLKDYITILPRVEVHDSCPIEMPPPNEGECMVWIGSSLACDKETNFPNGKSLILRITDPKDEKLITESRSGKWINPCSLINCDFEGKQFPQFIPENITLVEVERDGTLKSSRSVFEILQRARDQGEEASRDLLPSCVDLCINDTEALEVADACGAVGLQDARQKALLRAVFLNRDCVPAMIQLADSSLEAGALVDAALLLSEANRVEPLPETIALLFQELMGRVAESPDIGAYKRALAGGEHPEPKALRRILVVTNLFPPQEMGGYGRKIWEFANGLKARGHTVEVLTSNSDYLGKKPDESEFALESVVRRELVLMGEWKGGKTQATTDAVGQKRMGEANARIVLESAKRFNPEVVLLGNLDFLGVELLHGLLKGGIPVIHSLGNQTPWYQAADSIHSPLYVIAPASDWLGRNLLSLGYTAPRLETVYPGARIDRFYRHFLPDARRLRIAFAGLVMHYKGPHILLDALIRLHQAGIDFEAEFAGDSITPDFVEKLRAAAAVHGIGDKVTFSGFLSRKELSALFARSNVLVFPTLVPEAFGISQVEAMAGGLIVLTSGTGGTTEIVRHLEDGIVFDPNDPGSLASWLGRLATDPNIRTRLQANARTRALKFSVTASVVVIERIAESLLNKNSRNISDLEECSLDQSSQKRFTPTSATLEVAVSAFNAGRLAEAEDICRELLGHDEKCAGAWSLMGRLAALNGDLETARDFAEVSCELEPNNAAFLRELAEVLLNKGDLENAEAQARRVLDFEPENAAGLVLLGRILSERGERAGALTAFERALRLKKDDAEAIAHYAQALQKMGRGKDAISQLRKACTLEPTSVEFVTSLGLVLEENTRYVDALAAFEKAVRLNPHVGFVWYQKGRLLNRMKKYPEALVDLQKAISLPGALGRYFYEYGLALQMSNRALEALAQYDHAISLGLNIAQLHSNRGVVLKEVNRHADAVHAFHRAVLLDPENVNYMNNLGAVALEIGFNTEALACFKDAVARNPNLQTAHNNIGNLLKDRAKGAEALPSYRRSMELSPETRDTKSNYLLCYQYIPYIESTTVFEEHKKWGLETAKLIRPVFNHGTRKIPAGEKIRLGFLSADLCQHPVGVFLEPFFQNYDRTKFEVYAYADYKQADRVSVRLQALVDVWRESVTLDHRALAEQIHKDGIDVLFELAGHTALNRLDVFAFKPAPVQVTYLGYPSTTGLPTIDFRLTDAEADPIGTTGHLHTEKLIPMADCAWCYNPHPSAPPVAALPALANGFVTFACFNNMAKWNEALYTMWLEILERVPDSHLRLKARTLLDITVRQELEAFFTERGIARERLEFSGHATGIPAHLAEYNKVDIALDSYPYHGTTTTCEALWMGSPVVTLAGKSHVSRVGVSLLKSIGLTEGIATTREDYVEKAARFATDLDRLSALRASLRDRMLASSLMDAPGHARRLEAAVLQMIKIRSGK